MLNEHYDVTTAAYVVGYESLSHFSREYSRILALQSSAAGSAQNVGIQILDRTGEVLVLDGATFSAKTDLIDGTNILPFQARYIALGQSVAGTANADATFKVQYL
ncbi:fimbrial protein [Escherichia coli]|nr:fimbrial protein [Escherichia coli]